LADQATLEAQITEAETALHQLVTLQKPVSVTFRGRAITYRGMSVADAEGALIRHIARLKSDLLALKESQPRRGPIYLRS